MKNFKLLMTFLVVILTNILSQAVIYAQTNPSTQSLPYYEDFSDLNYSSSTYPNGWKGWKISSSVSENFQLNSPAADITMKKNSNASVSTEGIQNYYQKLGILNGTGSYGLVLAVKTTGYSNIVVQYDIMTIRNPYNGTSNTSVQGVELQYRVGTSGNFKSVNSRVYYNGTTSQTSSVTSGQNEMNFSVTLPDECNNQNVVQLRWVTRNISGSGSSPSFAIDNIDVMENGKAAYYYYKGTGSLTSLSSWGINSNGTGETPQNFTDGYQYFIIKNTNQVTLSSLWTVSGENTKVIVGTGSDQVTFTTTGSGQLNGVLDVENGSKLVISQSTANLMKFGNMYPGSAVEILVNSSLSPLPGETTFENLLMNSSGGHTYSFNQANIVVKKDFTLSNTNLNTNGSSNFRMFVGGDFNFSGTAAFSSNFSNLVNLTFNGSKEQVVKLTGKVLNVNKLTIENSASSAINLSTAGGSSNIQITSGISPALNMSGGNIELNNNTITLGSSVSVPGTLNYISGYFTGSGSVSRWFGNSSLPTSLTNILPFGSGTNNRNVYIAFSSSTITSGGKITISHNNASGSTAITPFTDGSLWINKRSNMSWSIKQSDGWNLGSNTVSIRIYAQGLEGVNNVNDLSLISNGEKAGGSFSLAGGSASTPYVNRTSMSITNLGGNSTANTFYIGADADSPLPVTLSSFSAAVTKRDVSLIWSTSSEVNNSGFEIERRAKDKDGYTQWEKIGFVNGNGTTNSEKEYRFEDKSLNVGVYQYRLKQVDFNGNFEYHQLNDPSELSIGKPMDYDMSQNYPNPSNPASKINYQVPFDGKVSLKVYDITGKEVASLVDGNISAGYYTVQFNGTNLASGVYFYRIIAENSTDKFTKTMKMILVK